MISMKPPLQAFDAHSDEVFASFLRDGQTREEALASTERYFLTLARENDGTTQKTFVKIKMPEFAWFSRLFKPFMNVSS